MANLLQNTTGVVYKIMETNNKLISGVIGYYGVEDYIKMGSFEGFLQNFIKVSKTIELTPPPVFGLKGNDNNDIINIEITY